MEWATRGQRQHCPTLTPQNTFPIPLGRGLGTNNVYNFLSKSLNNDAPPDMPTGIRTQPFWQFVTPIHPPSATPPPLMGCSWGGTLPLQQPAASNFNLI